MPEAFIGNSSVVRIVTLRMSDIDRVMNSYTRQNEHYKKIHKICKLVWEHSGISDFFHGNYSLIQPIFVDMNEKFEDFVLNLFWKHHGQGEHVHTQKTKSGKY